jgi:hypothetical protein
VILALRLELLHDPLVLLLQSLPFRLQALGLLLGCKSLLTFGLQFFG